MAMTVGEPASLIWADTVSPALIAATRRPRPVILVLRVIAAVILWP